MFICRVISCVVEESVCYDWCVLLVNSVTLFHASSYTPRQTSLLLQISLDFLLLYSSPQEPGSPALHTNSLPSEPPGKPSGKESACQWRRKRLGFYAWVRKIPLRRKWLLTLQYSCWENPMDRGAWRATVHGVAKSRTHLSNFHLTGGDPESYACGKRCSPGPWGFRASGSHICPMWVSFLRSEPSLGTTENSLGKSCVHYCMNHHASGKHCFQISLEESFLQRKS